MPHGISNGLHIDGSQNVRTRLINTLDPDEAHRPDQYRGWFVTHFHGVSDADKPPLARAFAWLREKEADIWTGLFREVAQYGQDRDTAKLVVSSALDASVRVLLTDEMDDRLFDFPLTIKLRLPDAWQGCSATQGDHAIQTRVVDYKDAKFILAQIVPDRGEVILKATEKGNSK